MFIIPVWLNIFFFFRSFLLKTSATLFACDDASQSNLWSVLTFNMCISPIVYKFHMYLTRLASSFFPVLFSPPRTVTTSSVVKLSVSFLTLFQSPLNLCLVLHNLSHQKSVEGFLLVFLHIRWHYF